MRSRSELLFWFGLDKCQMPTKTAPSLPLLNWTGERKYDGRFEGGDKDRERSLTNCCHGQNRLNLGRKGGFIHHQSNQSRIVRNKSRSSNTFPLPLPSCWAQLHSCSSPFSPRVAQGDGDWTLRSAQHTLSLLLLVPQGTTPRTLPLLQPEVLSQETVLHKLLQCESFPRAAALLELPQRGSLPRGAVLQGQAAPAWVPTGSPALPATLLWRGLLSPWVHRSW